jgi:hypothetical protein
VSGNTMEGTAKGDGDSKWRATRGAN